MLRFTKAIRFLPQIQKLLPCKGVRSQHDFKSMSKVLASPIPMSELKQRDKNPIYARKYLPGSWSKTMPKYLADPRDDFPYAIRIENPEQVSLTELGQFCRKQLDDNLSRAGAVLFRGAGIKEPQQFKEFTSSLGYQATGYEGGTGNRREITEDVYSAGDDPSVYTIELHNEMACSTIYPKKVMFCCLTPPQPGCGGLTPISKNSENFKTIDPEVIDILKKRKIRYLRYLPDVKDNLYTSWQQSFMTNDKRAVDNFLRRAGFNYRWNENGSLFYWYVLDPIVPHPVTGELIWFNQVEVHHNTYYKESPMFENTDLPDEMYPTHSQYGDGAEVDPYVLQNVRDANWNNAVGFDWQEGDVMVVDNILAMHSRLGFTGERTLIAHLTSN